MSERERSGSGRVRGWHIAATGACLLGAGAVSAQEQAPAAATAAAPAPVSEVVVTGTRIAGQGVFSTSMPISTIGEQDIKLSGTADVQRLLSESPQFVGALNGGSQSNVVPGGQAYINLRGLGDQRTLVLVDGRRFTVQGTDLTTDINTIPAALIERTEIVTGGSSAVYGSDAIAGVVNFVMKKNFEGVQLDAHTDLDSMTGTPSYTIDLTTGNNFADDRGNIVVALDYLNRGSISRSEVGYAQPALSNGCVTPSSFSSTGPGTPVAGNPSGQACLNAGGVPGFIAGGSSDIPNGRFAPLSSTLLPGGSNAALNSAYAAAGLSNISAFGWTYNDAGTTARPALNPQDLYNNSLVNYLQVPQKRWMINSMAHYDVAPGITAYAEMHFSDNQVMALLAPSNSDGTFLFNVNNPYVNSATQGLLAQLDAAESPQTCSSLNSSVCTTPGDGIAALAAGRRFADVGNRVDVADREAYRFVGGIKGDLGNLSAHYFTNLSYDAYYLYTRTNESDHQTGAISKSRLQSALLSQNGAAPVCDIFGETISSACERAIAITSSNLTHTQLSGGSASLSGTVADLPAGPAQFVVGAEHRETQAVYQPDFFLSTGDVAGFNPSAPTSGSETVTEAFGEVRVPLLAHLPGVESLSINGAFRYSNYDLKDLNGVWTYSGGANWRITEDVGLRGQYQHAIRAPNVGELYGGQTTATTVVTDPCNAAPTNAQVAAKVRAICVAQGVNPTDVFSGGLQPNPYIANTAGGNPLLTAEESNTVTAGVVLAPRFIPGFTLSADYYSIDVKGAIEQLSGGIAGVLNSCYTVIQSASSAYCQAVQRDPATGQIINVNVGEANAGALKVQGIDFVAAYTRSLDFGLFQKSSTLHASSDWTYTIADTLTPIQDLASVNDQCAGAYGPTCLDPIPTLKGVTRLTWSNGPVDLSLRWRYIGSVTVDTYLIPLREGLTPPALDTLSAPVIAAQNYFDLSVDWYLSDHIQLSGGINNILGRNPPILGIGTGYGNTFPATYDPYGQTFFLNATLKL